jgi:hypothetical protein
MEAVRILHCEDNLDNKRRSGAKRDSTRALIVAGIPRAAPVLAVAGSRSSWR